ncbi:hypothetical protein B296_00031297 [Ensete ventricosum]|uniref:Uncharacterized protein n=1 Tax=Ensete ventricosum TaxID=4639 RepID=A0A426ZXS9_ENSVE|nr:hypothetical protein B296_00031297 [Ensete ventricosum]
MTSAVKVGVGVPTIIGPRTWPGEIPLLPLKKPFESMVDDAEIGLGESWENTWGSDSAQQQFPNQSRPSMTQEQFVLFSASKRMKQRWAILTCSKGWCSAFESWQCFWRIPSRNDADRVQRHRVGPGKEINQSDWLLMSIISQRGSERKLAFHGMQQQCMHQRAEMSWNKPTLLAGGIGLGWTPGVPSGSWPEETEEETAMGLALALLLFRPPLTATLLLSTSFWREKRPVGRARVETGLFDWRENRTCGVGFGAQSGSGFAILGGNIHSQRCLLKRAERARIYT